MITVALAAGYATRMYPLTEDFPKPLLPVGGRTILDLLLCDLDEIEDVVRHVVVSNHKFIRHFERWAHETPLKKPVTLIDDGSISNESRLGAVNDLLLAIEREHLRDDLLVLAADNLLDFSLRALTDAFAKSGRSQLFCYHEADIAVLKRCGVATLDAQRRMISMEEKPPQPKSHWAVPPFYLFAAGDVGLIRDVVDEGIQTDAPGSLVAALCERAHIEAQQMPGRRVDVGNLEAYARVKDGF